MHTQVIDCTPGKRTFVVRDDESQEILLRHNETFAQRLARAKTRNQKTQALKACLLAAKSKQVVGLVPSDDDLTY